MPRGIESGHRGRGGGQGKGLGCRSGGDGNQCRMRFGTDATPGQARDPSQEKLVLQDKATALQSELDLIKQRLSELEPAAK